MTDDFAGKTVVFGSGYVAARRAGADTGTRYIALHSAFGHSDMMQRDKESLARNSSVHRQRLWRVKGSNDHDSLLDSHS